MTSEHRTTREVDARERRIDIDGFTLLGFIATDHEAAAFA
jgi:hypothetical protein